MIPFYQCATLNKASRHGFFTRLGGVSTGIYSALNTHINTEDDAIHVAQNRALIAEIFGVSVDQFKNANQVHSNIVHVIENANEAVDNIKADALVTKLSNVLLAVQTADCVPILLTDGNVIAACHGGWRGLSANIVQNTVDAMVNIGANLADINATIGPCIHQANYQFSADLKHHFEEHEKFFDHNNHFNLPLYAKHCLEKAHIGSINSIDVCTYEHSEIFFSCRYALHNLEHKKFGDQSSVIIKK